MKKILFFAGVLFISLTTKAQSLPNFNSYKLDTPAHVTEANPAALKAANFLLETPINDSTEKNRSVAMTFLVKWMSDSPDYTFSIDHTMTILDIKEEYMSIYLAAMVKYQIENNIFKSNDKTKIETWKIVAEYAKNPENNVKVKGKIKKLLKAYEKNELEEFLSNY